MIKVNENELHIYAMHLVIHVRTLFFFFNVKLKVLLISLFKHKKI